MNDGFLVESPLLLTASMPLLPSSGLKNGPLAYCSIPHFPCMALVVRTDCVGAILQFRAVLQVTAGFQVRAQPLFVTPSKASSSSRPSSSSVFSGPCKLVLMQPSRTPLFLSPLGCVLHQCDRYRLFCRRPSRAKAPASATPPIPLVPPLGGSPFPSPPTLKTSSTGAYN